MNEAEIVSAACLWLLALCRLPRFLRRDGTRDDMFIAALTSAGGATIHLPCVHEYSEHLLGVANISTVVSGALIMYSFGLFRVCIVKAVVEPEKQAAINRRGMKLTTVALTIYVVAFICAMLTGSTSLVARDPASDSDVAVFVFMGTFCLFLATVGITVVQVCAKYIPSMSSKLFRTGFRMVMFGAFTGLIALAMQAVRQSLVLLGGYDPAAAVFNYLYSVTGSSAVVLFASGLILPSLSRQLVHLDPASRLLLASLDRIWRRCSATNSRVVLDHGRSPLASAVFSRDPARTLHRTLVEILDSHLASKGELLSPAELKKIRKTEESLYVAP